LSKKKLIDADNLFSDFTWDDLYDEVKPEHMGSFVEVIRALSELPPSQLRDLAKEIYTDEYKIPFPDRSRKYKIRYERWSRLNDAYWGEMERLDECAKDDAADRELHAMREGDFD